jgi:alkylation response protein AidB-like acyl-CoA dehydrogenase
MDSAESKSPARPSAASLLAAAKELAPQIRAAADEIERTRELPTSIVHAIADAGIFLMAVPKEIGGSEIDLPDYVAVIEELGKADASTAWAVNQGTTFGCHSARMQKAAAREIWIDTPRSVVANSPAPTGKAVPVPGGYRVSAHQGFSTGCRHSTWIAAHTTVMEDGKPRMKDDGKPETRYCLIPAEQVRIHDTWHTRGMRGTGTHHFEVNDVFVPAERTVWPRGGAQISGGPRYVIPITLAFACGDAMIALAVARSCLEAFYELAGIKEPRYLKGLLRDQPIAQFAAGQAEAAVRSGRAFLMEAVHAMWDEVTATGALSMERRIEVRLATTHAIRLGAQVVESIYSACGATAAFEGHLIQRLFQDIHVITQHVQGRLAHYETVGQHWLGMEIDDSRLV